MKINDVKVAVVGSGMACGPVLGNVTAEAKVTNGDRVFYAGLIEVDGAFISYYESETSLHDMIVEDEYEDTDFVSWGGLAGMTAMPLSLQPRDMNSPKSTSRSMWTMTKMSGMRKRRMTRNDYPWTEMVFT